MTRLFFQIYLAFLGVITVSVGVSAVLSAVVFDRPVMRTTEEAAAVVAAVAASPDVDLEQLLAGSRWEATLYAADGAKLGSTSRRARLGGIRIPLPDGRQLVLDRTLDRDRLRNTATWLGVLGLCLAGGAWPIARRISVRLERVEGAVRRWGTGALDARAPVEGRDEVASVARAFNEAAGRVEELFAANRRVLASASHELRSPLARLRMALELVVDGVAGPDTVQAAIRDVEELDDTVGDLLQVGRLQAVDRVVDPRPVDLWAVVTEEAAAVGATMAGAPVTILGDPRLVRRLVRNLLENARRHGAPPIEVTVEPGALTVSDRGPGVPEELRQRIFEPFFRPAGHDEGRDGGVGLGLYLVRQIARHHGGEVQVVARDGGGTSFVVQWR